MVRLQYLPPTNRINATDKKTKLFILNNFTSRPVCHTSRKECSELTGSSPNHFTIPMDIKSRPL